MRMLLSQGSLASKEIAEVNLCSLRPHEIPQHLLDVKQYAMDCLMRLMHLGIVSR